MRWLHVLLWSHRSPLTSVASFSATIGPHRSLNGETCRRSSSTQKLHSQLQTSAHRGFRAADSYTLSSLLRLCTDRKLLADGRSVHDLILRRGAPPNVYIETALINMYGKCGMTDDAYSVFLNMPQRTLFTWNTMILAFVNAGQSKRAISIYVDMRMDGIHPDEVTLITIIRVFIGVNDVKRGSLLYAQFIIDGFKPTVSLCNNLLDMYIKCNMIEDAIQIFESMSARDVISWTHMITGHVKHGNAVVALKYFCRLLMDGLEPDEMTFSIVLHACAILGNIHIGRLMHSYMIEMINSISHFTGDTLVDMYGKCQGVKDAEKAFRDLPLKSVVSWNSLLTSYINHERENDAFGLFYKMQCESVEISEITIVSVLNACILVESSEFGMIIHHHAVHTGLESSIVVGNALIKLYSSCGSISDAQGTFTKMKDRTVVSWNAAISGLLKNGHHAFDAIEIFEQMRSSKVAPDVVTFVSVLNAIALIGNLHQGWIIHSYIIEMGLQSCSCVGNALIDMYSKCGSQHDALHVFSNMPSRDVVSWNAIVSGLSMDGLYEDVITFFFKMMIDNVDPDRITYALALDGCAQLSCLKRGHLVHNLAIEDGLEQDLCLSSNIIRMYINSGWLASAQRVFGTISNPDIVSWTLMLAGYTNNQEEGQALKLFDHFVSKGSSQDEFTFMNALNACAGLAAFEKGKMIHALSIEHGFDESILVGNALIDMYSKCGSTDDAQRVLESMPKRSVVSWNAMISGFAEHGQGNIALQLVDQMQYEGANVNNITSLSVLSACSHTGLPVEGYNHFKSMNQVHGIKPTMEHYACMIDNFGRTGHFEEALDFMSKMPHEPSVHVWKALLRACHIHCNLPVGKIAAEKVLEQDSSCAGSYVMLSNIYGTLGMWKEHAQVIKTMKEKQVRRQAGYSQIEINKQVYSFLANDTSHPQTRQIHAELDQIFQRLKIEGYEPDTSFVRHDVDEDKKELMLRHHSEKLAIAFGLLNTQPHTPLYIIKNLRVCGDCHTASKYISKIMKREIILRDNVRFHRIKHGVCSCGDYW